MNNTKEYTREQMLEAIEQAYYDGMAEGESDDDFAGEAFTAENYLPEPPAKDVVE